MLFQPRWVGRDSLFDARLAPAIGACAGICAGYALSRHTETPTLMFLACALLGAATALIRPHRLGWSFALALTIGFAGLAGAWYDLRVERTRAADAVRVIEESHPSPPLCEFRVMLLESPSQSHVEPITVFSQRESLRARARILSGADANGRFDLLRDRNITLHLPHDARDLQAGSVVNAVGMLLPPRERDNPADRDTRLYASQDNLVGSFIVDSNALIQPDQARNAGETRLGRWIGFRASLRDRARTLIRGDEDSRPRILLAALVLGERERGDTDIRDSFTSLGLAHIMAISGFHVTIMVGVLRRFIRVFWEPGRHEGWITCALLAAYLVIVAPNPPIWRSAIMTGAIVAAENTGRRYHPIAVLGWTAAAMLIANPLDLWEMGFQLSFLLVGALMVVCPIAHQRLWGLRILTDIPRLPRWWETPIDWLRVLVTTSLVCWSIALPIVAYHTGTINLLSIPATVIVMPAVLLLLAVAYPALLIGMVIPPLGGALAAVGAWIASLTAAIVGTLDNLPFITLDVPQTSLALVATCVLVCLHALIEGSVRSWRTWIVAALLAIWIVGENRSATRLPSNVLWRLDTFAVGDGSFHLLRSGRDALVWDCGSISRRFDTRAIRNNVRAIAGHHAMTSVITHPNLDHYNFMQDAAGALHIKRVLVSQAVLDQEARSPQGELAETLRAVREAGVGVTTAARSDEFSLGECTVRFLSPPPNCDFSADNDHSLVASIKPIAHTGPSLLLTGDIQREAILALINSGMPLEHDAIEAPHHGSFNDAAYELISRVEPGVIVQSTGPRRLGDQRWDRLRNVTNWRATAARGWVYIEAHRDGTLRVGSMR